MSEELSELLKVRRDKLDELRDKGINPFPYTYEASITAAEVLTKFKDIKEGENSWRREIKI